MFSDIDLGYIKLAIVQTQMSWRGNLKPKKNRRENTDLSKAGRSFFEHSKRSAEGKVRLGARAGLRHPPANVAASV